ncbi:MAG: ComEC/Rec2 family competence protein [Thermovenabulum sp.]|uniref:ComEC/Rec2 family competence protein n=1 Tax=Thermovenabulum sp. TaxID=3100335 RepID=UPI003C7B4CBA
MQYKKINKRLSLIILFLFLSLLLTSCFFENTGSLEDESSNIVFSNDNLYVTFLDVGQADCIFVRFPDGKTALIDAGNNDDEAKIVSFLKRYKIYKIDYLFGTHPHEDHIGSLDSIIYNFEIGKIFMPKVTTTTKTFKDVLEAVSKKNLKISAAKAGMEISPATDVRMEILAPNSQSYEDLNNYSIVLKITYKNTSFLLTGDAESLSEREMLSKKYNLKADVLKVAHHGSSSSTSLEFLKAVSPKYAVISYGKGNDYGHPHKETISKLIKMKIKILTTAEYGDIIFKSDGEFIELIEPKSN